jgi:uracil-DNA glycosylase family 4
MAILDARWPRSLRIINNEIVSCRKCERLVDWREQVAATRRRAYLDWEYWGRPVPSFGDPEARLLIIGLAPGAHGANRTGRMFTGDRSGEFLYRALYQAGFANQPNSSSINDGLELKDAFITAPVHCAPPDNKPTNEEITTCSEYLTRELRTLKRVTVVVALGGIAFQTYLSLLKQRGSIESRGGFRFGHGAEYQTHEGGPTLLACYHPSQQNTSTGKLTETMLREIFVRARDLIGMHWGSRALVR